MARRIRKKKKTDETLVDIVEVRDQAQGFIEQYRPYVFGALVVVVVIFGGLFAYKNFYEAPRQKEAVEQMYLAQNLFERDSFALALTKPGSGNLGFLDIIDSYKGTKAANLANYYAGISYLNLGQYEAAISFLEDYNPSGSVTPTMKAGAIGDAYSELQNYDKAMNFYNKAVNANDNEVLTAYYLKKLGLMHERNGNFNKALDAYKKIKKEYPASPDGREIDKYITRVSAKG